MNENPEEKINDDPAVDQAAVEPPQPPADPGDGGTDSDSQALDRALEEAGGENSLWSRGEALGPREAAQIAAERRATVIVLAGSTGSGKTTLLASLYERLGRGPLAGHFFDGSRTLHGFELRCHRSIYGSGPGEGEQGHTPLSALPWLHLRLSREHEIFELLLGDYSGERFEALASGREKPTEFPQLRRADHLCIVLDGGALADPSKREAEEREALELLRAILSEPESYAGTSAISIVITKWDLVLEGGTEAREAAEEAFDTLRGEFKPRSADAPVGYIETAARSVSSELPLGHGVDDLLARWTDQPAVRLAHPPEAEPIIVYGFDGYRAG